MSHRAKRTNSNNSSTGNSSRFSRTNSGASTASNASSVVVDVDDLIEQRISEDQGDVPKQRISSVKEASESSDFDLPPPLKPLGAASVAARASTNGVTSTVEDDEIVIFASSPIFNATDSSSNKEEAAPAAVAVAFNDSKVSFSNDSKQLIIGDDDDTVANDNTHPGIERAKNKEDEILLLPVMVPRSNSNNNNNSNSNDGDDNAAADDNARSRVSFGTAPPATHERRLLLAADGGEECNDLYSNDLGYGEEEEEDENMDASHVRLKKRLSKMEQMQSRFFTMDEKEEKTLPQDTFSFMIVGKTWKFAFVNSLIIFFAQVTTFVLVLLDLAAGGEPGNVFGVPANVSAQLRTTQFIAVLVAVLTQGDLRTAFTLLRDGFTCSFDNAFLETSRAKYQTSIACRAISGSIGLVVSFILIVTAPSVVELLLNFTAIEFVSSIDELCFYLSKQGFMGASCKTLAMTVSNTTYKVTPESRQGWFRRSWKTVSLFMIMFLFMAGWITIVAFQLSGLYVCDTIMVQMGDDFVASLGTFNGIYDLQSPGTYVPFQERRVEYAERRSQEIVSQGRGVFAYCDDISAWTFRWEYIEGESNACDWVAKSDETSTFDITETADLTWYVRDATQREVVLDPMRLYCFTCEKEGEENSDDCGGNGSCNSAVCTCGDGWYGLRCEFPTPCTGLAIDFRTEEFASTRDWSREYESIELASGSLVEAYHRPVYVHEYESGQYDVVMFTGRRWALTSSEFLPEGGKISDGNLTKLSDVHVGIGHEIGNFFKYIFHGYKGYFEGSSVAFLSDFMDGTTYKDASTPVGFQWFRAEDEQKTSDSENQGPAREVNTAFLCRICNEVSNPCLYDGKCSVDEGRCQCSLDSFGSLCEIPPVGNGHCDPFFNIPEFKMDGGDCCESTCTSAQYLCGAEEQGYVSTGYSSCMLPSDVWRDAPLNGDAGSFAGFSLDLSIRSVVVGEILQDRVRIYDKVGSSWELRDTLEGAPESYFGTSVALSSGPYNVVSNPSFRAPLIVAVHDGSRTLRTYKCNLDSCDLSQEFPLVKAFDLSDDGFVLATSAFPTETDETGRPLGKPPTVIRVYDSKLNEEGLFQPRGLDFNVTKNGSLFNLITMSLGGDGSLLVVQNQRSEPHPELGFQLVQEEYFDINVWNPDINAYELETELPYDAVFNSFNYQLSLGVSQDNSVLAFGSPICGVDFQLHVFSRDNENKWSARPQTPVNETDCVESERPPKNNNLALSLDGSSLAFRLGTRVEVFQWNDAQEWRLVGDHFPHVHYPIAMSSDGAELAIGSPEDGIGGLTNVYSLPESNTCPTNSSSLRISLTLDRLPSDLTWRLTNNSTGEVLFAQGEYPKAYAFGTIVEETCVDSNACYEFALSNKRNRGLQAPGQYALLLDGKDIGRGTFGGLYERKYFGNCNQCPDGTEFFSMQMLTCGPIAWALGKIVDQGNTETAPFVNGTTFDLFPDQNQYESCAVHGNKLSCENPLSITYDSCLDPNECYGANVRSPYNQLTFIEMELGGVKTEGDANGVCVGETTFAGNPDKCLQEDFGK